MGEFDLIERYFVRPSVRAVLGPGDDCALLALRAGHELAVSSDMLVLGQHFFEDIAPENLGHKSLAVNLSDLAACAAKPLAYTLSLALPSIDPPWVEAFARGLHTLADIHGIELIGGDTTRGPLTIAITVLGEAPRNGALLRSGGQAGDDLWVSGVLGDARLALEAHKALRGQGPLPLNGAPAELLSQTYTALDRPTPQVELGLALREIGHAAIDVSDGLVGDLQHVLTRSRLGAQILTDEIPRSPALAAQSHEVQMECLLAGGDDYQILFSAAPHDRGAVMALAHSLNIRLTRIGHLKATRGLDLRDALGEPVLNAYRGFDHFDDDRA